MTAFATIVIGEQSLLVQCSEKLLERGHSISAVVTRNPAIADWAANQALPVVAPGKGLAARLVGRSCDWLFSIGNLAVLPDDVLALAERGAVNFHDGPLPRHAGLNAPVWALIEGESRHGITWHRIESGIDTGNILVQRFFDIGAQDTALTLNTKAFESAIDSFDELVGKLEADDAVGSVQNAAQRSYHARLDRPAGHGLIDWTRPAAEAERMIRALDHGPYWNPLCCAKLRARDAVFLVGHAKLTESHAKPGTVIDVTSDHLTVACIDHALVLSVLRRACGLPVDPGEIAAIGDVLSGPASDDDSAVAAVVRHEAFWRDQLAGLVAAELPLVNTASGQIETLALGLSDDAAGLVAVWAARLTGQDGFDIAFSDTALAGIAKTRLVSPWVPIRVILGETLADMSVALETEITRAVAKKGFFVDLAARDPALAAPVVPMIGLSRGAGPIPGVALTVELKANAALLHVDTGAVPLAEAVLLAARLDLLSQADQAAPLSTLETLPDTEHALVVQTWNATGVDHDRGLTMAAAFEAQVDATPDMTALVYEDHRLSYAELDARANRTAHLLREMGVDRDTVVGLHTRRGIDLLVGALAVLKAGGAYLPLDPGYPADRLNHYIADSGAPVIITQAALEAYLPKHDAQLLVIDAEPRLSEMSDRRPDPVARSEDLAYLIYTSGSTGTPKGVMVEHRNVVNFYRGMDDVIPHEDGGTWLAVTSLSFDISVLELFWTTARGLTVVLTSDEDRGLISRGPMRIAGGGMEFSIYYWGNDDGAGRDKYALLLEGAKFADENGFVAVWTPERHFHAFGGPYPNPSVTGAAVAGVTKNIGVRGGSVVSPLHHPARIAEEWAVIDNLTNGRAGMAIASGWQPDDFILRPENTPPENKTAMIRDIDTVRRLWRGEAVAFPRKDGNMHEVVTQPRPVSRELPVWVTTAGNPETWKEAGRNGCNVLTHLLGQSIDEVAGKIGLYHAALREAGHDPNDFTVTLMLHTCLSDSRDHAREIAREPMKDYLRSAAGLIKQYAWAFPAFKRPEGVKNAFDLNLDILEGDELDAILDFAFERYFNDSGLFGTIEDALERTEQLRRIGVTEIACLIDYGIPREQVLEGLWPLAEVVARANAETELAEDDFSIAAQIIRHGVTHLQCTPSMARMIAMNDEARQALRGVKHLFLGGEPLPGALVSEFAQITKADITNMYGPTETTIWSSVEPARSGDSVVNLGLPLANQQLYVLDASGAPVGVGEAGELWIGGEGVTRGYWNRPELTAERFLDNPFHPGRMYRTGDLVRRRIDGRIDFLGRVDHQVKLRGHRIELGEIEAALEAQDGVSQAVVSAREDQPGDVRLVGYYTGRFRDESQLKTAMAKSLPAIMVPGRFVHLDAFPLTPNKKVDRNALPAPSAPSVTAPRPAPRRPSVSRPAAPGSARTEGQIAEIWTRILGVQGIAPRDNFFDLGGHSLLAVQAHRAIREQLGTSQLSITDIFRFPVLGDLAARVVELSGDLDGPPAPSTPGPVSDRAQARSDAMARRRAMRARRRA
ncbi:LLM class flavin-dependent oxidoreductase [Thalassococcus sp. CAU 1522]|uniref:LLM class flavin-dependent oxidoreductase n=1 Tax=Thalassococcus arenae TaxID=2851652 RepID=A0ABS6N6B4_9RHOB|nr:MupA/Atu3671 family FMN-dependent luciferase-like monooxygenase [Thalassococcus arenae]MBV2359546.1 LLM class flavin-dependent oxidoreductase [Thalassococcus arenae]